MAHKLKKGLLYFYLLFRFPLKLLYRIFFEWKKLGIKKGDVVADFGSGGNPLIRADVIMDKFLSGVTERPGDFIDTGAYIIQCDLAHIPLKDKVIDFSYSNHVVEHLDNLRASLNEMERTAKKGIIICPSAAREQIAAHKMHLWFVENKAEKLLFTRKEKPYPAYIGDFFDKLLACPQAKYWFKFEKEFKDKLIIEHSWKEHINFEINDSSVKFDKNEGESEFIMKKDVYLKITNFFVGLSSRLTRFIFGSKLDIAEILCCPNCKNNLEILEKVVICRKCNSKFKHKEKRIFYFLENL